MTAVFVILSGALGALAVLSFAMLVLSERALARADEHYEESGLILAEARRLHDATEADAKLARERRDEALDILARVEELTA